MSRAMVVVFVVCLLGVYYCIQNSRPIPSSRTAWLIPASGSAGSTNRSAASAASLVEGWAPWTDECRQQDGLFVPENIHATMRTDVNLDKFLEYGYMSKQLRRAMEYQKKYAGTNPPPSYTAGSQIISPYGDVVVPIEPVVLPVATVTEPDVALLEGGDDAAVNVGPATPAAGAPVGATGIVNTRGEGAVISAVDINDNAPDNTLIIEAPAEDALRVPSKAVIPAVAIVPPLPSGTPETVFVTSTEPAGGDEVLPTYADTLPTGIPPLPATDEDYEFPGELEETATAAKREDFTGAAELMARADLEGWVRPVRVTLFYSPACPYCREFMRDVWPRVRSALAGRVVFAEVDGARHPDLAAAAGVAGYPSLLRESGVGAEFFRGARVFGRVAAFAAGAPRY